MFIHIYTYQYQYLFASGPHPVTPHCFILPPACSSSQGTPFNSMRCASPASPCLGGSFFRGGDSRWENHGGMYGKRVETIEKKKKGNHVKSWANKLGTILERSWEMMEKTRNNPWKTTWKNIPGRNVYRTWWTNHEATSWNMMVTSFERKKHRIWQKTGGIWWWRKGWSISMVIFHDVLCEIPPGPSTGFPAPIVRLFPSLRMQQTHTRHRYFNKRSYSTRWCSQIK